MKMHFLRVRVRLLSKIDGPQEFKGLRPITILLVSEKTMSKPFLNWSGHAIGPTIPKVLQTPACSAPGRDAGAVNQYARVLVGH